MRAEPIRLRQHQSGRSSQKRGRVRSRRSRRAFCWLVRPWTPGTTGKEEPEDQEVEKPAPGAAHLEARAASIAAITSGESGLVECRKRRMIFPSRPIRNLLKFHLMSPGNGDSGPARAT